MNGYMRTIQFFLLLVIFENSFAGENGDSIKNKLKANATFSLNSNGISSIPSFSLDKPALFASVSLVKNRFSYEPVLAYGLDLKPWFIDNWFNYKIINRQKFAFITGFNASAFFSEYKLPDETILQSQRYFAFAFTGIYKFTPNTTLTMAYWNDRGQEKGTLNGHYLNLMGERSEISIGNHILLVAALQLFYINYDGNNDGIFVTPRIAASVRKVPFSLFFQGTQAITSNISPFPDFNWNVGLAYSL